MQKKIVVHLLFLCSIFYAYGIFSPAPAQAQSAYGVKVNYADETEETEYNLQLAVHFKEQYRYELARKYFLLALATCRGWETRSYIQQELKDIHLQIMTLR